MAADDTLIRLPPNRATAIVTIAGGRTLVTTRAALGLALVSEARESDGAAATFTWQDHLATHGVAVGIQGRQVATLGIIAPRPRTLRHDSRDGEAANALITPPAILAGIRVDGTRFKKGVIFIPDMTRQAGMGVTSGVPVLANWPHGNVYEGGAICWGGVSALNNRTLVDMVDLFFGSGFNHDLRLAAAEGCRWQNGAVWGPPPAASFTYSIPQAIRALMSDGH